MTIRGCLTGACALALAFATPALAGSTTVPLSSGATTSPATGPLGGGAGVDAVEINDQFDNGGDSATSDGVKVNRSIAAHDGVKAGAHGKKKAKSNPELIQSFDGINFHDQRYANGGNNFSVEPPDQALCAGNGFVVESGNDVLRVFDSSGHTVVGPIDLNTFYGYPSAINRKTGKRGPSITDPTCLFDKATNKFFHVVLTIERSGRNHLDIAVTQGGDPRGAWTVFSLPVQNDGTQGTPNHHCAGGPCLGDYPHIGADANAFFITTNEFALRAPGFYGAQVYAISKAGLANNASSINAVLFNTAEGPYLDGTPGFTVWPAIAAEDYDTDNGGTELFLSSQAVFQDSGTDTRLRQWAVTNTSAIDSNPSALALSSTVVDVVGYGVPGPSQQKAGDLPLRDCLADPTCYPLVVGAPGVAQNGEAMLDSNDSRMQQVYYANGKLWSALDTGLAFDDGTTGNGIAYFVISPENGRVRQQGYVGLPGNNVNYPAVAVNGSGRGVIAFTLVGNDHYPSAGYVSLDAKIGAGDIHVVAEGKGPQDGFTGYLPFSDRPRWGDYGAAAVDGKSIWMASEYIGQTCNYQTYRATLGFNTCGQSRGALGNWDTRVTQVGF